jgi:hypothetical protein
MRYLLLTCLLFFPFAIKAQYWLKKASPFNVYFTKKPVGVAPVYFLGKNYYQFNSSSIIDSVTITDTNNFKIEKTGLNIYVISRNYSYDKKLIYPASIFLTFHQKNKKPYRLAIPVKLYPPVKIRFYKNTDAKGISNEKEQELILQENDTLSIDGFYCRATWDYPDYVEDKYPRLQGHFHLNVISNGKIIEVLEGWNDTGDRTRPFLFDRHKDLKKIEVTVSDNIETLITGWFVQEYVSEKLIHSSSTPRKVFFKPLD